jgi:ZIP family zinc transporter
MGWLAADALAPVLGAATPFVAAISPANLALLLGLFAGTFLVIGGVHLLPEAQHEEQGRTLPAFFAGCALVYIVSRLAGV